MKGCIAEDDLLDLARGARALGDAPDVEAHLSECAACSAVLAILTSDSSAAGGGDGPGLAGRSLGPYRLDARIGAGAMGEVYRAWDARLDRHVAVKVLSPRASRSPEQARRLVAEGRAAAAIAHPNVVTIHDVGSEGDQHFIVSELYEGESLRSRIDRGPIPRKEAFRLGVQLARGLAAAHAQGVVHRDLKPTNLLISATGTLKILDFGLAKITGDRARDLDATEPGAVLGTAGYLAPEQARGEVADARSDLFATGAILYEMLCGRRAFDGATFAERVSAVLRDTPAGLADGSLGEAAPIVARCLRKDPRERFQSAEDLAWVLEGLIRRPAAAPTGPVIGRRTLLLAAGGAALGSLALGRLTAPSGVGFVGASTGVGSGGVRGAPGVGGAPLSGGRAVYQQLSYRHGRVTSARFTRDAGSVVHSASWDGLPAAVFTTRIGGGGTRLLDLPSSQVLSVSSHGEVAISIGHRFVEGFHAAGRLAVAPLEGGEPRVLAEDIQEADHTPDGRELAVIRRGGKGFRVELPLGRPLFEAAWVSHARVSPDGAEVACLVHPSSYDDRGDVVIVARATGKGRVVSEGWSSVVGLAWSPAGDGLWFSAARDGANNGVVAIDREGRETFAAETTGRLRLHDVASDGRVAVTHDTWSMPLRVRPPGAVAEIDVSLSDVSIVADMSEDGRTIVFGELGDVESSRGCYLRSTLGGQAVRLGDGGPLALAMDGERVLALAMDGGWHLYVYSKSSGARVTVPLGPIADVGWGAWRDARRFVLGGAEEGRSRRLWHTSLDAKAPSPLTEEGLFGRGAVSPDGERVVFIAKDGRLLVLPIDAPSGMRAVPGVFLDEVVCGFRAGGEEVFVRSRTAPIRIRRVALATGKSVPHLEITPPTLGLKGVDSVVLSAAGDAYAYSHGRELSRLYAMTVRHAGAERPR